LLVAVVILIGLVKIACSMRFADTNQQQ